MEAVEYTEPPLKRRKVLLGEPTGISENPSVMASVERALGDEMARPQTTQGDEEAVGSGRVIRKSEFIRIITRALYSLGLDKSGALLEEESGIPLHSSAFKTFLQQVSDGKWDESVATLHLFGLSDENTVKLATFLLLEQKLLEFLKIENVQAALNTLRKEIAPLNVNNKQVRKLASSCIFPSTCPVQGVSGEAAQDSNSRSKLMKELQALLPASMVIPENRLEVLVEKALDVQRDSCVFHNTSEDVMSLYSDHQCGRHQIPSQTVQILESHKDEVWFLQFSHDGRYLASSSKDLTVIIWEVKEDGQLVLKHRLLNHQKPVITISWSHDDCEILTCGLEEDIFRWDVYSGLCLQAYHNNGVGSISCGWSRDGKRVFAGMADRSICTWDLNGGAAECWQGQKIQQISDMAITSDGKWFIWVRTETAILLFDWETKAQKLIVEEDMITSFSLSMDNKYLLVNLINQEIHLWSIEEELKIVSRYKGHRRSRFLIRSCFGGNQQAFIASGSEDSQVYIWNRSSEQLIQSLPGHSGSVNCVSWSPTNIHMLASGSDDSTIRIWGIGPPNLNGTSLDTEAASRSNGR